jgi:membrane fusion protein (multidrug efflux system)
MVSIPAPRLVLALLAAASTLGACSSGTATTADPPASGATPQPATPVPGATSAADSLPVETVRPQRSDMVARHDGTANLQAEADAEVVARVGGAVVRIAAEEGQRVRAGDLLAVIDPRQLRLEMAQARAQLDKVENDYRRQVELHQKGLVAAGAFESTRFELAQRRATWELARLQLSHTELRAPFDGVVAERHVKAGQNLAPGTTAFRVVDAARLRAELHAPERQLSRLRPGQPVLVSVDALPGRSYAARVARIAPTIDARTATFKLTVELNDPSGELKPGMFARVGVIFEHRSNVLSIPAAALLENSREPTVFVVDKGVAAPRRVRLGLSHDGRIEIVAGLRDDEQVVISGQNSLKPGLGVRVVALAAADSAAAAR